MRVENIPEEKLYLLSNSQTKEYISLLGLENVLSEDQLQLRIDRFGYSPFVADIVGQEYMKDRIFLFSLDQLDKPVASRYIEMYENSEDTDFIVGLFKRHLDVHYETLQEILDEGPLCCRIDMKSDDSAILRFQFDTPTKLLARAQQVVKRIGAISPESGLYLDNDYLTKLVEDTVAIKKTGLTNIAKAAFLSYAFKCSFIGDLAVYEDDATFYYVTGNSDDNKFVIKFGESDSDPFNDKFWIIPGDNSRAIVNALLLNERAYFDIPEIKERMHELETQILGAYGECLSALEPDSVLAESLIEGDYDTATRYRTLSKAIKDLKDYNFMMDEVVEEWEQLRYIAYDAVADSDVRTIIKVPLELKLRYATTDCVFINQILSRITEET